MNMDEREIDLLDLFFSICQKWRIILLGGLICMLLGGTIGYKAKPEPVAEETVEDIEENLNKLEITPIDEYRLGQFHALDDSYKIQEEINNANPILNVDPASIYISSVEYAISDNKNSETIAQYMTKVMSTFEDSTNALNRFRGYSYFTPSSNVVVYNSNGDDDVVDLSQFTKDKSILYISVLGEDEASAKKYLSNAKNYVESAAKDLTSTYGDFSFSVLSECTTPYTGDTVVDYINKQLDTRNNKLAARNNIIGQLSDNAKKYIELEAKGVAIELVDDSDEASKSVEEAAPVVQELSFRDRIRIKYIALGLIAGMFVVAGVYGVLYILNGKLRIEDEFESLFPVSLLGMVSVPSTAKGLDKLFYNLRRRRLHNFTEDETIDMITSGIKVNSIKNGISKVYATGCSMGEREQSIMTAVAKKLADANIELIVGKPVLYYADALEESASIGSVVIVEKALTSGYEEIAKEIKSTKARDIKILGAVVVE